MFDLLEITITQKDKDVLSKRNDFLHGRIPFEKKESGLNTELYSDYQCYMCKHYREISS